MKYRLISRFLLFLSAYIIQGCETYSYIPPATPVPLFDRAGRIQITGHLSDMDSYYTLSYAATRHFNFFMGFNALGAGIDYAFPLNSFFKAVMEVSGGSFLDKYYYRAGEEGNAEGIRILRQLYFQPTFGITSDFIDLAFSLRFLDHRYHGLSSSYFFEPFGTLKVGYKYIKLFGQFGISRCFSCIDDPYFRSHLYDRVLYVGLQLDIPILKSKKK